MNLEITLFHISEMCEHHWPKALSWRQPWKAVGRFSWTWLRTLCYKYVVFQGFTGLKHICLEQSYSIQVTSKHILTDVKARRCLLLNKYQPSCSLASFKSPAMIGRLALPGRNEACDHQRHQVPFKFCHRRAWALYGAGKNKQNTEGRWKRKISEQRIQQGQTVQ